MLCLRGAPALSDFRLAKLATRLREAGVPDTDLYAEFMHFVDLAAPLDDAQSAVLERLLRYGPSLPAHEPAGRLVLVTPRPGTISPWSSKATDIARNAVTSVCIGTGPALPRAAGDSARVQAVNSCGMCSIAWR